MKPKFLSAANLVLGLGVLAIALVGCANQAIRIKAVDATTEKPLAGVTVTDLIPIVLFPKLAS